MDLSRRDARAAAGSTERGAPGRLRSPGRCCHVGPRRGGLQDGVPASRAPATAAPGDAVPSPARGWVAPVTLEGRLVRLEPLARAHLPGLIAAGADPETWTWMRAPLTDEPSMRAWLEEALEARDAGTEQPFATIALASGRVVGSTRYMAIVPAHRRLEIGWTWLTPSARGGGANTEAKLLMLAHAFEVLGAMRVELKTDARNVRSRAALVAIGATFEEIARRHQVTTAGRIRDSAWYAVVDKDWPAVRERLGARLASRGGSGMSEPRVPDAAPSTIRDPGTAGTPGGRHGRLPHRGRTVPDHRRRGGPRSRAPRSSRRRRLALEHLDHVRRFLVHEPRGPRRHVRLS